MRRYFTWMSYAPSWICRKFGIRPIIDIYIRRIELSDIVTAVSALGGDVATVRKFAVRDLTVVKIIAGLLLVAFVLDGLLPRAMAAPIASDPCQSMTMAHDNRAAVASHPCPGTPMSEDCVRMIGCFVGSVLGIPEAIQGHIISEGDDSVYWMSASLLAGRTVPPDLSPPITNI